MFLIHGILLALALPVVYSVRCVVQNQVKLPMLTEILLYLDQMFVRAQTGEQLYCSVFLKVDAELSALSIVFKRANANFSRTNSSNIYKEVSSLYEFPNRAKRKMDISVSTEIVFVCSNADHCDRTLTLEYLHWLLSDENQELIDHVHSTFSENGDRTSKISYLELSVGDTC